MTEDSTGRAPTYEEVVIFAHDAGLLGKVNTAKFYEYYKKQGFRYRGYYMDWQTKLREWANKERGSTRVSAAEQAIVDGRKEKPKTETNKYDPARLQKLIDMI